MVRVGGEHHVLRVELLLGEPRNGERAVLVLTIRRRRELARADGTIELSAAAAAAPAVTLPPPLWVVATLLIGFCFLGKWPWREVAW